MLAIRNRMKVNSFAAAFVIGLSLIGTAGPTFAEPQSAEQIIRALKPPRVTRGLTAPPVDSARAADDARFIDTVRNKPGGSLSTDEREKIASIAKAKPSVDLEINFEYNSATIAPRAIPQVTALGQALTSPDLKGQTYILAGHTDATGGDAYNQVLSERRADAVKSFLFKKYGIDNRQLVIVGYGKTQLKNTTNPAAPENRRVQVINASE
ncbi:MAG: OmpA family protein [Xanthobacteraceae bacterium]